MTDQYDANARLNELFGATDHTLAEFDRWHDEEVKRAPGGRLYESINCLTDVYSKGWLPAECRDMAHQADRIGSVIKSLDSGRGSWRDHVFKYCFLELRTRREDAFKTTTAEWQAEYQEYCHRLADRPRRSWHEEEEPPAPPARKPCPESWAELFGLRPIISYEQLRKMKGCDMDEIYRQARLHGAIDHLPPQEQATARRALLEVEARHKERDQREREEAIAAALAADRAK